MQINRSSDKKLKKQLKRWKGDGSEEGEAAEGSGETTANSSTFSQTVQSQKLEILQMKVTDLVDEVKQRGQSLVNRKSISALKGYKESLASFLKKAQEYSKEIKSMLGQRRTFRETIEGKDQKEHVIVETIDEQVDALTKAMVDREEERIDVADHVGEIRGLVVDLVSTLDEQRPDE